MTATRHMSANTDDLELQMSPRTQNGQRYERTEGTEINISPQRRGILHLTVDTLLSETTQKTVLNRQPPRWRTPEFYIYYLIFAIVIPAMVWKPISLSKGIQI